MDEGGWEGSLAQGHFSSVKELAVSETKQRFAVEELHWTEIPLFSSFVVHFCLPHPSQLSPVTLCNSFFQPLIGFLDCLNYFFILAHVVFASQLGLSDFFWLVRRCCFLPSYFYNVCFKRNTLGLCTRSFLSSFQWQNGAHQQFLNGHVTIPGELNRTKCRSEMIFLEFNHQLHPVDQWGAYSFKPQKLITVKEWLCFQLQNWNWWTVAPGLVSHWFFQKECSSKGKAQLRDWALNNKKQEMKL